jgi:hypothetical protein
MRPLCISCSRLALVSKAMVVGGGLAQAAEVVEHLARRLLEHGERDLVLGLTEDRIEDGPEEPADAREHCWPPKGRRIARVGEDKPTARGFGQGRQRRSRGA